MTNSYVTWLIHMWHASYIWDKAHSYVSSLLPLSGAGGFGSQIIDDTRNALDFLNLGHHIEQCLNREVKAGHSWLACKNRMKKLMYVCPTAPRSQSVRQAQPTKHVSSDGLVYATLPSHCARHWHNAHNANCANCQLVYWIEWIGQVACWIEK